MTGNALIKLGDPHQVIQSNSCGTYKKTNVKTSCKPVQWYLVLNSVGRTTFRSPKTYDLEEKNGYQLAYQNPVHKMTRITNRLLYYVRARDKGLNVIVQE